MRRLALLVLPFALAACDRGAPDAEEPHAVDTVGAAVEQDATLDLQATGIVVPPQGGFEELSVPFGSVRGATEATLANIVGAEVSRDSNEECGAGPMEMTGYEGITLNFQDDAFVGWYATAPYVPELTRAQMLEDSAVHLVEGSTLGEEFTIGFEDGPVISGLFSGEGDDATVESLWAGTNCIFR